jgi:hypothetical protein
MDDREIKLIKRDARRYSCMRFSTHQVSMIVARVEMSRLNNKLSRKMKR